MPVTESLYNWQQHWKDRVDSSRLGLSKIETPVEDLSDPDRLLLRFAGQPLVSGRVYDIQTHIAEVDIDTAAREVAAVRRHEVAEVTMQTVHEILVKPPPGSTRAGRQEAVIRVMHDNRRDMFATHLYPRRLAALAKSAFDLHR